MGMENKNSLKMLQHHGAQRVVIVYVIGNMHK